MDEKRRERQAREAHLVRVLLLVLAVPGCGDDGSGPNPPANLIQISGSEQIRVVGVPLAQPFVGLGDRRCQRAGSRRYR